MGANTHNRPPRLTAMSELKMERKPMEILTSVLEQNGKSSPMNFTKGLDLKSPERFE